MTGIGFIGAAATSRLHASNVNLYVFDRGRFTANDLDVPFRNAELVRQKIANREFALPFQAPP